MNLIRQGKELKPAGRAVCVAIGMFDGVHLGHQRVLQETLLEAQARQAIALAITFDRHPNAIVAPARTPPLIYPLSRKVRTLATLGLHATWLLEFDRALSEQSGEAFVEHLVAELGSLQCVCVGRDFTFGHRRGGNLALLQQLGRGMNFVARGIPPVMVEHQPVSSTRIREAIAAGDFATATSLLGRPYSLAARVIPGDHLGRELGFPTANLEVTGLVLPPPGVYVVGASAQGRAYWAVANVGARPTVARDSASLRVEAHLLDFDGSLYEQELDLTFVQRLRDEIKFPTLDALRSQIRQDVALARAKLAALSTRPEG